MMRPCVTTLCQEFFPRESDAAMLNCTRQWGKSTIAAAKAIHTAIHEVSSVTVVVSLSSRQSGELVRKAEGFARRLGIPASWFIALRFLGLAAVSSQVSIPAFLRSSGEVRVHCPVYVTCFVGDIVNR
jgi:hypothetical protein